MQNLQPKTQTDGTLSPHPRPGFEEEVMQELGRLVAGLPAGVATLRVNRNPRHPESPEPYLDVIPTNAQSARLIGIAVRDDLYLTIGEVEREFAGFDSGGNIVRGATWQEELQWIWQAVVRGGFSQRQSLDSDGKVVGGTSKILINGQEWDFRGGKRAETLFSRPKYRTVVYEPYYK